MTTVAAVIFLLFGAFFILVSAIGIIRFSNLFTRMHATTKATSFGLLLVIVGASLHFNVPVVWLKTLLVIIFIYLTAPLAAHSIAKSAEDEDEKNNEE